MGANHIRSIYGLQSGWHRNISKRKNYITKINIKELRANLDVKINNGLVKFNPHKSEKYVYQLKVDNGQIDTFKSQYDEKAYKIKIYVNNGQIE